MVVKLGKTLILVLVAILYSNLVSADPLGCCCDVITGTSSQPTLQECSDLNNTFPWIELPSQFQEGGSQQFNFSGREAFCNNECAVANPIIPGGSGTLTLNGTVYNGSGNSNPLLNAIAYLNIQGTTTAGSTNINGYFEIINVPRQEATLYITHPQCLTQVHRFNLNANNYSEFNLDCGATSCNKAAIGILNVLPTQNQIAIDVTPAPVNPFTCTPDVAGILVCLDREQNDCMVKSYNNPSDLLSENSIRYDLEDNGFGNNGWINDGVDSLYIWIFADYSGIRVLSNNYVNYELGDSVCYTSSGSFCLDDAPSNCNGVNLETGDSCENNEYCYDDGTTASCQLQLDCDQCNSITNSFANIFWIFNNYEDTPFDAEVRCTDTIIGSAGSAASCSLSASHTSRNYYERCDEVTSCYDYTTRLSCEGSGGNPCGVSSNCEWINSEPSVFGKGICKPTNEELDCKECTYQFGEACDASFCSSLSDGITSCALATRGINEQICVALQDFSCTDYVTQEECVGPLNQGVDLSINYSSNNPSRNDFPIFGDNSLIHNSSDLYGIGYCSWGKRSNGDLACIKDANKNGWNDDCGTGNLFLALQCITDYQAPRTILPLQENQVIDIGSLRNIEPLVEDNVFSNIGLQTYFCLEGQGITCDYPSQTIGSLNIDQSGEYVLKYFSQDPSDNYEIVRQITLFIENVTIPEIEEIVLVPR